MHTNGDHGRSIKWIMLSILTFEPSVNVAGSHRRETCIYKLTMLAKWTRKRQTLQSSSRLYSENNPISPHRRSSSNNNTKPTQIRNADRNWRQQREDDDECNGQRSPSRACMHTRDGARARQTLSAAAATNRIVLVAMTSAELHVRRGSRSATC